MGLSVALVNNSVLTLPEKLPESSNFITHSSKPRTHMLFRLNMANY